MRRLYLVPILHTGPDMGSLAPALAAQAAVRLGKEQIERHQATLAGFWREVARFFDRLTVAGAKVYQDGLVAGGAAGGQIILEGARRGSANFQVVAALLAKGACLVETESLALVKREHIAITAILQARSVAAREAAAFRYRLERDELLRARDDFIAGRIAGTLNEGEMGILFIGAYHDVPSRLPGNFEVIPVKNVARVREYHQRRLAAAGGCSPWPGELAVYLTAPVEGSLPAPAAVPDRDTCRREAPPPSAQGVC